MAAAGRLYTVPFNATSLGTTSGGVDLFAITSGATYKIAVETIVLDPCATSTAEFSLSIRRFTSTYTAGSGGSSITPSPLGDVGDASSFTAKIMNTTKTLVNTGTNIVLLAGQWNLVNGWIWTPTFPDHVLTCNISQAIVVMLDTTPASQTVSGYCVVREG